MQGTIHDVYMYISGSLREFLHKASTLRLPFLVSKPVHSIRQATSHSILTFGMNAKKSHEVDAFSQHVNHFASQESIKQVSTCTCTCTCKVGCPRYNFMVPRPHPVF